MLHDNRNRQQVVFYMYRRMWTVFPPLFLVLADVYKSVITFNALLMYCYCCSTFYSTLILLGCDSNRWLMIPSSSRFFVRVFVLFCGCRLLLCCTSMLLDVTTSNPRPLFHMFVVCSCVCLFFLVRASTCQEEVELSRRGKGAEPTPDVVRIG